MSHPMLTVKQAGPLAMIQDAGRFGVGHLGVTQGGAADWIAFRWANWLLGNPLGSDRDGANGHIQLTGRQSIEVGLRIGLRHQLVVEVVDPCDLAPNRQTDAAELVA